MANQEPFLLNLRMKNIGTVKEAFIDFSRITTFGIVGEVNEDSNKSNGAGKTTIFSGVSLAWWGRVRKNVDIYNSMNDSSETCEVSLEWQQVYLGKKSVFNITRKASIKGSTRKKDEILTIDGEPVKFKGRGKDGLDAKIRRILGTTYETMMVSNFFLQGQIDAFSDSLPSKRLSYLQDIIGTEQYQKGYEIAHRKMTEIERIIDASEAGIKELLPEYETLKASDFKQMEAEANGNIEKCDMNIKYYEDERRRYEEAISKLSVQEQAYKTAEVALTDCRESLLSTREGIKSTKIQIEESRQKVEMIQNYKREIVTQQGVSFNEETYRDVSGKITACEVSLSQFKTYLGKVDDRKNYLLKGIAGLNTEIYALGGVAEAVASNTQLLRTVSERVQEINGRLVNTVFDEAAYKDSLNYLETVKKILAASEFEYSRLIKLHDSYIAGTVESGSRCKSCGTVVTKELVDQNKKDMLLEIGQQLHAIDIAGKREKVESAQALIDSFEKQRLDIASIKNELAAAVAEKNVLVAKLETGYSVETVLKNCLDKFEQVKSELFVNSPEWGDIYSKHVAKLCSGSYGEAERKAYTDITALIEKFIDLECEAYQKSESEVAASLFELKKYRDKLDKDRADFNKAQERIAALSTAVAEDVNIRKFIEISSQNLTAMEKKLPEIQERFATLETQLTALKSYDPSSTNFMREKITECSGKVDETRKIKDQYIQYIASLAESRKRKGYIEEKIASVRDGNISNRKLVSQYSMLKEAYGKTGIPALMVDNAFPFIEERANEILMKIDGNHTVEFRSEKELKDGSTSDTMDIYVTNLTTGKRRIYETFSGAEKQSADIAMRKGLSDLLANRKYSRLPFLFMDEPFGAMDIARKEDMIEVLHDLGREFTQVGVISHDSLKEVFPTLIKAVKQNEVTTYQIVGELE